MKCKFCREPMEDGQTVCPSCGKSADEKKVSAKKLAKQEALQKKRRSTVILIAAAAVLAVIAAVLICAAVIRQATPAVVEHVNITGGSSYTAPEEGMTEELLQTVVADTRRDGLGKKLRDLFSPNRPSEYSLTNETLALYYWDCVYNFYENYGGYAESMGMDLTALESSESIVEGQTWQEYFLSQALDMYRSTVAMCDTAERKHYILPQELEDERVTMEELLASMSNAEERLLFVYGTGVSAEAYMNYINLQYTYGGYTDLLESKITPSDRQLVQYYNENAEYYASLGIVMPEDPDTVIPDAEAVEIYETWKAGDATEESFAAMANEYSTDDGSNTSGGLYTNVSEGMMVEQFNDWCFDESRQSGDTGIVETRFGYHIMYFVGKNDDGTIDVRHILVDVSEAGAWKNTVTADYISDKLSAKMAKITERYVLDYDLSKIALPVPGQVLALKDQ